LLTPRSRTSGRAPDVAVGMTLRCEGSFIRPTFTPMIIDKIGVVQSVKLCA
jgi:hypothetical protein